MLFEAYLTWEWKPLAFIYWIWTLSLPFRCLNFFLNESANSSFTFFLKMCLLFFSWKRGFFFSCKRVFLKKNSARGVKRNKVAQHILNIA